MRLLAASLLGSLLFSSAAFAETNMVVILDASNSMWGKVDGKAKIETARSALGDMLKDLPAETKLGVIAYGHTSKDSCKDVATLMPLGATDKAKLASVKGTIDKLKPMGKTPIAYSLEQGGAAFAGASKDAVNQLVLISDGIESCEGDPCAVAEKLAKQNVNTKVHVVGFDVDATARKQLECIAAKGNGKYFNASNVNDFKQALTEVKKVAVEPTPEPVAPKGTVAFEDKFDGKDLAPHWTVLNPAPDNFIVDKGELMLVSKKPGDLTKTDMPNLIQWSTPLPEGDFEMEVGLTFEAITALDRFYVSLYDDANNWVAATLKSHSGGAHGYIFYVTAEKNSEGQLTKTEKPLVEFPCNVCENEWDWSAFNKRLIDKRPIVLKIRKEGVNYIVSGSIGKEGEKEGDGKRGQKVYNAVTLDGVKQLRPRKNLVLGVTHTTNVIGNNPQGEAVAHVDYVKMTTFGGAAPAAAATPATSGATAPATP